MPDSRKARRIADPGLQPERTSLAWFRTMLGYGALMALAIKHNWHQAGMLFWISIGILAIVALILWHYTRNRNLMDVTNSDAQQVPPGQEHGAEPGGHPLPGGAGTGKHVP